MQRKNQFSEIDWQKGPGVETFFATVIRNYRPGTQALYYRFLPKWIRFCCDRWGVNPEQLDYSTCTRVKIGVHEIKSPIQQSVIEDFLSTIPAPSSRTIAQTVLHVYFNWLVIRDMLSSNPVPPVDYKSKERPRKVALPRHEIESLIAEILKEPIYYRAPFAVQLASGLRVGELVQLRTDDISEIGERNWVVYIRREALKGRHANVQPIPDLTLIIQEYIQWRESLGVDTDILFVDVNGKPHTSAQLNKELHRLGEQAGCSRRVTTHDLRRGFATLTASQVGNSDVVRQLMRQNDWAITIGYIAPFSVDEIRETLKRVSCWNLADTLARDVLERWK